MRDARICLVTLGVDDLARAGAFYEALGWTRTDKGNDSVVFLQGVGIVLALFGRADLEADAGTAMGRAPSLTLAVNLPSRAETTRLYEAALAAGATGVKAPQPVFWGGFSGYFADPDGHLWELAHNPFFPLDADGRLDLLAPATEPGA